MAGVDDNDPNMPLGITAIGTYIDAPFITALGNLIAAVSDPDPHTVAAAAAETDKDTSFTHSSGRQMTMYRLREGIERFFITDINNPAASTKAQSELAVQFDIIDPDTSDFSHVPGGGNVLYMDGHVQFLRYPSEHPVNRGFANIVWIADHM
jgi:prepilin-type processing-associated H-X9-DG protein